MNTLILWILIPVALITAVLLSYLLFTASIKRKKATTIDELSFSIKKERMAKVEALLNRVRVISKSNSKHIPLFNDLTRQHTEIDRKINRTNKEFGFFTLNSRKMKRHDFEVGAQKIRDAVNTINVLQHKFETTAENITQQDDFLSAEISFYTNNLRKAIAVYRQKRILLNRIAPRLDDLSNKLKSLEKAFNVLLDEADVPQATIVLNKYSNRVVKFSEIINEGPTIQSYLYVTIPSLVQKLVKNYKEKKIEVGGAVEHIGFAKSINKIGNKYKKAKEYYLCLKIDKAKKEIRNILKSLKIIERLINLEIKSRNTFIKNYEECIEETKKSLNIFVNIRKQLRAISGRGIQIPYELSNEFNSLSTLAKELDHQALSFRTSMKSKDIPYSGKLSRMKLLVQKNQQFIGAINEITSSIWALNVEKLITKNKFRKAEAALNEIVASTKREKIILSDEELQEFESLSHELSKLAPSIIADDSSKVIKDKVNDVVDKTINYYHVVGGKIQIAEIIKNIIKEFSAKRAINQDLNAQLSTAETYYLRGEYDAALNLLITHLEESE